MDRRQQTRRRFLVRLLGGAAALAGTGTALSALAQGKPAATPKAPGAGAGLSCERVQGLTAQQINTRESLMYTDTSPKPPRFCKNCQHYQPATDPERCGGCTVVPGPIHPEGWCTAWIPAMTQAG